jgi:hypothetical protein
MTLAIAAALVLSDLLLPRVVSRDADPDARGAGLLIGTFTLLALTRSTR